MSSVSDVFHDEDEEVLDGFEYEAKYVNTAIIIAEDDCTDDVIQRKEELGSDEKMLTNCSKSNSKKKKTIMFKMQKLSNFLIGRQRTSKNPS